MNPPRTTPLVWDLYPLRGRLALASFYVALVIALQVAGYGAWAVAPAFLAAIALQFEYTVAIDTVARTYTVRYFVRPFGRPKTGSLADIKAVRVSIARTPREVFGNAALVFSDKAGTSCVISSGAVDVVLREVARIVELTHLPVEESEELLALGRQDASVRELLQVIPG